MDDMPVAGDAVAGHDAVALDEAGRDALLARLRRRRVANQVTHLLWSYIWRGRDMFREKRERGGEYRVTHLLDSNLPLTSEQKFRTGLSCPDLARPKRNFCFNVNRRFESTRCVTLYMVTYLVWNSLLLALNDVDKEWWSLRSQYLKAHDFKVSKSMLQNRWTTL